MEDDSKPSIFASPLQILVQLDPYAPHRIKTSLRGSSLSVSAPVSHSLLLRSSVGVQRVGREEPKHVRGWHRCWGCSEESSTAWKWRGWVCRDLLWWYVQAISHTEMKMTYGCRNKNCTLFCHRARYFGSWKACKYAFKSVTYFCTIDWSTGFDVTSCSEMNASPIIQQKGWLEVHERVNTFTLITIQSRTISQSAMETDKLLWIIDIYNLFRDCSNTMESNWFKLLQLERQSTQQHGKYTGKKILLNKEMMKHIRIWTRHYHGPATFGSGPHIPISTSGSGSPAPSASCTRRIHHNGTGNRQKVP